MLAGPTLLRAQPRIEGIGRENTRSNWVMASDFGARFDGKTDDTMAIQSAIDWAHANSLNVDLPSGTALLTQPLSLIGRSVNLRGSGLSRTTLRAGTPLPMLIDLLDKSDVLISPFRIEDLTLDGARQTDRNLAIRYRHNFELRSIISQGAVTGIWEQDTWLGRRSNCRVQDCSVGWRLNGSNHSGRFEGCTFTACRDVHLVVDSRGAAGDGNEALLFSSCDIEFGAGVGVEVAKGATAVFDTCYIGEAIGSDVIRNRGNVVVRDGFFQFGHTADAVAIRPLGGMALFERCNMAGQQFGDLGHLADLSPAEVLAGANGRVRLFDIIGNFMVGGNVALRGDILAEVSMPNLVPRYGIEWSPTVRSGTARAESMAQLPRSVFRLVCKKVSGDAATVGFEAPVSGDVGIGGEPVYVVIVYRSSKPVSLSAVDPAKGRISFGTLPSTAQVRTFVKVDIRALIARSSMLALTMLAAPGDFFELHRVGLADGRLAQSNGRGSLSNLGLI